MRDKVKFHNMTKPVKFRRFKMFKQMLVLWCKAQRERIIYLSNYILYKLNILKRYSYRDNVVKVFPTPFKIEPTHVTTEYFSGVVVSRLEYVNDIDIDHFYYKKKDRSKKITLSLRDHDESKLFLVSHLEDIHIKVGDTWYCVDQLPVFKVSSIVHPPSNATFEKHLPIEPVKTRAMEFDILKLKGLRHKIFIGKIKPVDVLEETYVYCYEGSCKAFKMKLNSLTLESIIK